LGLDFDLDEEEEALGLGFDLAAEDFDLVLEEELTWESSTT